MPTPSRKRSGNASWTSASAAATAAGSCCQTLRIPVATTIVLDACRNARASSTDGLLPSHRAPKPSASISPAACAPKRCGIQIPIGPISMDESLTDEPSRLAACRPGLVVPEPAGAARGAELGLLGGVLPGGFVALSYCAVALQEVDLHLADEPVAELRVADPRPLVGRRRRGARDLCGDVVGHDERRRLGEDPRLRNGARARADVTDRVHVRELGAEVGLVDGHPALDR